MTVIITSCKQAKKCGYQDFYPEKSKVSAEWDYISPVQLTAGDSITLVKNSLTQSLYDQCGLSKQKSEVLVERIFELIKESLQSGDDVLVSGFGKFCVRRKAPRRGRNPATGEDLPLDARIVVTFKCSGILKDKMNGLHR